MLTVIVEVDGFTKLWPLPVLLNSKTTDSLALVSKSIIALTGISWEVCPAGITISKDGVAPTPSSGELKVPHRYSSIEKYEESKKA